MFGTGSNPSSFNFGGTPTPTTTKPATGTASIFGTATGTTQPAAGTTGIFGTTTATTQNKPGGFTFGGQQPTSAPTAGFNFGNSGTQPAAVVTPLQGTSATSSSAPGFGFGTQPIVSGTTAVKPLQPSTTTLSSAPAFGTLGSVRTTAATSTPVTGGVNFGTLGGTKTTVTPSAPTTGLGFNLTATSSTAGTGGLLGAVTATTTAKTSAVTGFALPVASSTAPAASTASTGLVPTTTSAATGLPQAQITYQQLEENINKWMADLEKQEKDFLQQATQVNAWDRLLVENGEKITALNSDMERVKIDQQKLDHELDFIKSQQRELEELLVPLEKSVEQQPNISFQQHADLERENTYQLAENVDAQLKRMVQDLKDIVDHLNTNTNQDNADPIQQITKILNAHMDALQWVDQNTALLGRRVEDVSKQMEVQRKEQERNFRLVYN